MEYEPVLVGNPGMKVTFQCNRATAFDVIRAVGDQTRIPIGVALGRDSDALTKTTHSYDLENVDARSALGQALEGTGYSVKEESGVLVLIAGDLAPRQRDLLAHPYSNFGKGRLSGKMVCLGMNLTGWLRNAARPRTGYAISCATATNEEEVTLDLLRIATTEEIANQLVSQGSHGMWIFKVSATLAPGDPTEEIDMLPYQHYSNRSVIVTPSRRLRATGGFWRYPGSLLLVSAFCIAERSFAMAPGDRYAEMVQAGTEAVTRGDLSVAKAQLEAAVSLQPGESSGWCELGVLYAQLGDYSRGEKAFRRALDLQPGLARAHYLLGLSLIAHPKDQLDWPAAIEEFRSALKIQPDYPEALNYLGVGLTSTGQLDAAIAELEHALLLAPQMPSAHFNLAIALENLGRLEDAATEYQKAIALKSYYAPAYSALGKLYFRMGKGPAAEEELRIALRQNPDLQDAHYALGRVLRSEGKLQDAEIEFHAAVSLGQREPNAVESTQLSNAALEKAGRGDLAGAETALRKAIALRPDYGVPHYNLGLILADEGRIDEAGRQLTEAISLMPGQAKPWFDLGRVQRLQGKAQSAVESVRWAAMLDPANPRIREELKLAGSAGDQGDTPDQPRQPEIGLPADTASGHYSSARDLRARQDWQGAIGELLRSLALQPDSVEVRSLLANTYGQLGDYDAAAVEYRKVLLAAPASGETYLSLGKVLLAGGKRRDAGEAFRRALAIQPGSIEARRAIDDLAASDLK